MNQNASKKYFLIIALFLFMISTYGCKGSAQKEAKEEVTEADTGEGSVAETKRIYTYKKYFRTKKSEQGNGIIATTDGGYAIIGVIDGASPDSRKDFYLTKTDKYGFKEWSKNYGGTGNDYGMSLKQTADGGYILGGYTNSFGAGLHDYLLVKTDANGNEIWKKTYGTASDDLAFSVIQTADGGYALLGNHSLGKETRHDFFLVKTDADGNMIWEKDFIGRYEDYGYDLQPAVDGGFLMFGYSSSTPPRYYNFNLIKVDADGNEIWNKAFGTDDEERGFSFIQSADGGFVMIGLKKYIGNKTTDIFLVKADADGNLLWEKNFGGDKSDRGGMLLQDKDGGYILLGESNSFDDKMSIFIVKSDADGNEVWKKTYKDEEPVTVKGIAHTPDGGYIIVGYTTPSTNNNDIIIMKIDSSGGLELANK